MVKITSLIVLLFLSVFASGDYLTDYKSGLQKAKSEHKLVAVTIVQTYCPWCAKFKKETLVDKNVSQMLRQNFVYIVLNRDTQDIPQQFRTRLVPTTFFVNTNSEKILETATGYVDAEEFMDYLNEAVKKSKK